jgi:hypothetical protein
MSPKKAIVPEEENIVQKPIVQEKPKRTRKMTPELLEKLKTARELALKAKREGKQINEELGQYKKETFSEKIDQVETYKKLKEKVNDEVKKNEIVLINKKMDELYNKFDGYLQEKTQRRHMKDQRKQEKKASQIVRELPNSISQHILEGEVKKLELDRWRKRMFGV